MTALKMTPKRGFLLDMDGVLYRGNRSIPHAANFLRQLAAKDIPHLFLTNHSCFTALSISRKLAQMGMKVGPEKIYSSAEATAHFLEQKGVENVFIIGEEGLRSALRRRGIQISATRPTHVVVGLDRHFTYEKLNTAARLISHGAVLIGTNRDALYPVGNGFAPECGPILKAVETASGQTAQVIGKPHRPMFLQAARSLGLPLSQLAMIGDRLDTDIAGARKAGAGTILTLTGCTTAKMVKASPLQPDLVIKNLKVPPMELLSLDSAKSI